MQPMCLPRNTACARHSMNSPSLVRLRVQRAGHTGMEIGRHLALVLMYSGKMLLDLAGPA